MNHQSLTNLRFPVSDADIANASLMDRAELIVDYLVDECESEVSVPDLLDALGTYGLTLVPTASNEATEAYVESVRQP